ncbi:hypothetical protein PHYSODRAFT_306074 [Phytophthora sojae]|uniref:Uncharacterized protein n=1 Tax=Phytophthora sojae (strain P6497) TaxID=1094619 RepID=G5A7Q9_PHYSP|nr:hypothetical protein PHYSODRAFT_306074 [Phytophthora sojae]EGZ07935.1 hypothetical protein PHYSODRAFT_306074 [Phytophthora sojae]|eukprot:XP_009536107.1 hypothetical protein PHYSODRAFT_306074 [Phytophthora sojae]
MDETETREKKLSSQEKEEDRQVRSMKPVQSELMERQSGMHVISESLDVQAEQKKKYEMSRELIKQKLELQRQLLRQTRALEAQLKANWYSSTMAKVRAQFKQSEQEKQTAIHER